MKDLPLSPPLRISLLGSGWLGLPLAKHLLTQGHSIFISSRNPTKIPILRAIGAEACLLDLADPAPLPIAFFEADVLIISITSKSMEEHQRVASLLTHASSIRQLIYTSSTSVYPPEAEQVDETSPIASSHPLRLIESLYQGLPQACCILRLAGLVGPDRHPGRFFRKRPQAALARVPSNLVHLHDLIPVFSWLMTHMPVNDTFNIAADEHPPKFDFYSAAFEEFYQQQAEFVLVPPDQARSRKRVSNAKIKAASGLNFLLSPYYPYASDSVM
ncbi:MAG: hypothetical protein AAF587_38960 [Bacteroidota bacterium]